MSVGEVHQLTLLDQAGHALAQAQSLDEIKEIRDKAEAVRKYAQSASLGLDVQNRAAELKLSAERHAGMLLAQMHLRGGDRRSKDHSERLKLGDLGISQNQSTRWQIQASIPENVFREYVRQTCHAGKELTSSRLMRLARGWRKPTRRRSAASPKVRDAIRPAARQNSRLKFEENTVTCDPISEIVGDLKNHHQLLGNILHPICAGESVALVPAERRVLQYLLVETVQLLGQLEELHSKGTSCHCHDETRGVKRA